jgi:hypothetical protein
MSEPTKLGDLISDYTLYEVPTICRDCGVEWIGKAFKPADDKQRYGWCESCMAVRDAPRLPEPKDPDLQPPRRTWEPD